MGRRQKGRDGCRMHFSTPAAKKVAARRLALGEAQAELAKLGRPIVVDPADAMLEMVYEAAGNVAALRRLVAALGELVDQEPGEVADEDGIVAEGWRDELGSGIAGRTDPTNWKAAPHVWVAMYDAERDRLVKWAKACRDAGVDERRVQVAESQGRQLAQILTATLDAVRVALLAVVPVALLDELWRTQLPGIVRTAIEATVKEEPPDAHP